MNELNMTHTGIISTLTNAESEQSEIDLNEILENHELSDGASQNYYIKYSFSGNLEMTVPQSYFETMIFEDEFSYFFDDNLPFIINDNFLA